MTNQPQPLSGGGFPPSQQKKGCLGRNWKWAVPVGCLGLILTAAALGVGVVFISMRAVKSSELYQFALEKAKAHPAVVAELGEPISDGWFVQGSVETSGGGGHAKFQIPISGPKKSGTIFAEASKDASTSGIYDWHYTTLEVEIEGRPGRISLTENFVPE
jgi:hypothetical protein